MARITLALLQQQLTDHQSAYVAASEQRDRALERLAYAEHSDEGLKYIAQLEASLDKGRRRARRIGGIASRVVRPGRLRSRRSSRSARTTARRSRRWWWRPASSWVCGRSRRTDWCA